MKSFNDIRENTITEAVDYDKLKQLARYGLVDKSNVTKLIAAFKKMEDGKILQPAQRELMLNVLTDLTGIITGDSQMFMKAKKAVSEEVESITELTAEEKRLVNTMYDKKGNLTAVGKKVMDHGKKNRFPHNTSASQGQRMGGKSTMYSEDALIDEKYDTPVKKKPVSMMSKAEKDKNDERRKAYKDYQKSLRKEDTMDEAISGDQYYYVDPKGVVVAVGNKDSMRKMNMKQAKDGNKGGSFSQNRKKYKVGDKINESVKIDEISMGKMAAYADKAIKSRNDAKAATHSADSNRRDKAQKTIVKRKAGADNYNKKMWGYSNVAPTKEHFEIIQDGGKVELIDIQEAPAYTLMHNTFSGAVQEAIAVAKKQGFEIDEDDWSNKVATGPKKPSKDKTNSYTIDLMKGGKPAKKKLHMQVYNMGPKYELNCYVQ